MGIAVLVAWATLGFTDASDTPEPPQPLMISPYQLVQVPVKEAPKSPEAAPVLPPQRPMPEPPKDVSKTKEAPKSPASPKDVSKTPETTPPVAKETNEPLTPAYPAFGDPRAYTWMQHRLPPADQPCVEMACQLHMCLRDHRCIRERVIDWVLHWPCPGKLLFGKCCPDTQ